MVADETDLDLGIGVCGKDGQSVPVGVGQPALKLMKSPLVEPIKHKPDNHIGLLFPSYLSAVRFHLFLISQFLMNNHCVRLKVKHTTRLSRSFMIPITISCKTS